MTLQERKTWRRVKVQTVRETAAEPYSITAPVRSGADVARLLRCFLADDPRENFVALYLDARHRPIGIHTCSIGTAQHTVVHPREVFGPAVALSASAVVVAHNHPSGDPAPSPEDRSVTERLRLAGELLRIELLDHVVIGQTRYFTFTEEREQAY